MSEVKFFFDPRCPWCYQTSKWAKRLETMGVIQLDWGLFSLEVVNLEEEKDPMSLEPTGSPALRTAVLVGERFGTKAIGPFYTAVGHRSFEGRERVRDQSAMIRDALAACGYDPGLLDEALADVGTWESVVAQTRAIHDVVGDVGVPTIVLDGGKGPAIFGPVLVEQPSDEDAVQLWRNTEWLVRYGSFAELKRKRSGPPDLPLMRALAEARRREQESGS